MLHCAINLEEQNETEQSLSCDIQRNQIFFKIEFYVLTHTNIDEHPNAYVSLLSNGDWF